MNTISGIVPLNIGGILMSNARTYMFNGVQTTVRNIAKACGLNHKTLGQRIRKNGGILTEELLAKPKETESLIGFIFGRLEVVAYSHTDDNGDTSWVCKCECGNHKTIKRTNLKTGTTKSCGCLARELSSIRERTHGHSVGLKKSPTYITWESMKYRCKTKAGKYGELGITVCDRWLESFDNFLEDIGERIEGTTLDRIDSISGYYKENCRWATDTQQNRNTTKCKHWIIDGVYYESHTEAASIVGLDPSTILRWCNNGLNNCSSELKYKESLNG